MTNTTKPTKSQIKMATLRVQALEAELNDRICREFPAAARCVREALGDATMELLTLRNARG